MRLLKPFKNCFFWKKWCFSEKKISCFKTAQGDDFAIECLSIDFISKKVFSALIVNFCAQNFQETSFFGKKIKWWTNKVLWKKNGRKTIPYSTNGAGEKEPVLVAIFLFSFYLWPQSKVMFDLLLCWQGESTSFSWLWANKFHLVLIKYLHKTFLKNCHF